MQRLFQRQAEERRSRFDCGNTFACDMRPEFLNLSFHFSVGAGLFELHVALLTSFCFSPKAVAQASERR